MCGLSLGAGAVMVWDVKGDGSIWVMSLIYGWSLCRMGNGVVKGRKYRETTV